VDVALLLRRAITRHALDAPTPATDAPVVGPYRVTYERDGDEYGHPYNGRWADAYDRAHRAASTCGQTCKYESPARMALRHAKTRSNDPTIDRVTIRRV
jgi:hypothetical protein